MELAKCSCGYANCKNNYFRKFQVARIDTIKQIIVFDWHLSILKLLAISLTYLHKRSGIVSSGLMFHFWFVLLVFAIPQYRSEIVHFQQRNHTFGKENHNHEITNEPFQMSFNNAFCVLLSTISSRKRLKIISKSFCRK